MRVVECQWESLTSVLTRALGQRLSYGGSAASYYVQDGVRTDTLYSGRLAEDAVLSAHGVEVTVPAPNIVWFYEDGELKYASDISEPAALPVQGRSVMFGDQYDVYLPLGLYRNGHVFQGSLYELTELAVQDKRYLFKGWVVFAEDGHLTYGVLAEDAVFSIQGADYVIGADEEISLYPDGTVKEVGLPDHGIQFRVGDRLVPFVAVPSVSTKVVFHPNGSVMFGCVAEDTVFTKEGAEVTVGAGTLGWFDEDGTFHTE